MAKQKSYFECSNCGYQTAKWLGRCPDCGKWNTLEEHVDLNTVAGYSKIELSANAQAFKPVTLDTVRTDVETRFSTGSGELDRVLGGGIVRGSLVLLGGEPGIGKSTLLLQICGFVGQNHRILYVSGEESARQIKLRAERLEVGSKNLMLLTETDVAGICQTVRNIKPDVVIIDSIQTMNLTGVNSSPGSVTQVRETTNAFMRVAKSENISFFIVGHVNKDGAIAGPKVMEHIVDAVLHFEGERTLSYRILRAIKNRFGSTNEIGVFEMWQKGLREVKNPSLMLLSERMASISGSCVVCLMEGSRPILTEVQSLVTKTNFGTPRRTAAGFDYNRLVMLIAVLEKRAGYFFGALDTYLNVAGGLRLDEPAADLPVALSMVSGLTDRPISDKLIAFGEVGLGGEIRAVSQIEARVKEAQRLGFTHCILPMQQVKTVENAGISDITVLGVHTIREALAAVGC